MFLAHIKIKQTFEHGYLPMSSSSKNETNPPLIDSRLWLDLITIESSHSPDLVNEPVVHLPIRKN